MRLLLKQVKIIHPQNPLLNHQTVNIVVENGIITYIGNEYTNYDVLFEEENVHASPGWFDMRANFSDPGFEHKEDLKSGAEAAVAGGFTEVCVLPSTQPPADSKDVIEYILSKTRNSKIKIWPMAFASMNGKGNEMAELYDLHHAGAIAFTDAYQWISNSGLVVQILQYVQMFNGLFISRPYDDALSNGGVMNESKTSVMLGLKGIPKIAEEIAILRDIEILKYTGGRIHFSLITTLGSVEIIRKAKMLGLNVTCDTAPHYLALDDRVLVNFDTNFKVNPPFREEKDVLALLEGLSDGTIDCLVSDHHPHDEESKNIEFDLAEFGVSSIETAFAVSSYFTKDKITLDTLIEKWSIKPRNLLKLPVPKIEVGEVANLTLFDPLRTWIPVKEHTKSKSKNNPFWGKPLRGKVLGTIYNKHINLSI